jgi:hypothetical protein
MAATSPWYYVQVLVNVNAFTNPSTSEGPTARFPAKVLWIEEGFW